LRVFAGPNGSGKSTIFNKVSSQFKISIYINPDDIAVELMTNGSIDLNNFELDAPYVVSFESFLKNHPLVAKAHRDGHSLI